jgi:hypothetical protein
MKVSKVIERYVIVTLDDRFSSNPDAALAHLEQEILRHCDDIAATSRENTIEHTCEFCGIDWEVYEKDDLSYPESPEYEGMPVCCDHAQLEWMKQNKPEENYGTK